MGIKVIWRFIVVEIECGRERSEAGDPQVKDEVDAVQCGAIDRVVEVSERAKGEIRFQRGIERGRVRNEIISALPVRCR